MALPTTLQLGVSAGAFELDRSEEVRDAVQLLAAQATRTLDIVSRHLDAPLFDQAAFLGAVRCFHILPISCDDQTKAE